MYKNVVNYSIANEICYVEGCKDKLLRRSTEDRAVVGAKRTKYIFKYIHQVK